MSRLLAEVAEVAYRFLFLADTQLGCYASFSGFTEAEAVAYEAKGMTVRPGPKVEGFEWDAAQYRRAVEVVNDTKPAFVVIGGDMIDDANSEDQTNEFLAITSLIDSEIPVRWLPGNHDIANDGVAPTPDSIAAYRAVFGPDYYRFAHEETMFIALNTPVIDHPENVPGGWERQFDFLQGELEMAKQLSIENVILLGHHPLFVGSADEPDTYWTLPLERRSKILEVLHAGGVKLGFAGHWHRNAIATDGFFTQVTSGPVGYPLGPDPSGYRVVNVAGAKVSHEYRALENGIDR